MSKPSLQVPTTESIQGKRPRKKGHRAKSSKGYEVQSSAVSANPNSSTTGMQHDVIKNKSRETEGNGGVDSLHEDFDHFLDKTDDRHKLKQLNAAINGQKRAQSSTRNYFGDRAQVLRQNTEQKKSTKRPIP